jgi:hypothetical protein
MLTSVSMLGHPDADVHRRHRRAEEKKWKQQVIGFIQKGQPKSAEATWIDKLNP